MSRANEDVAVMTRSASPLAENAINLCTRAAGDRGQSPLPGSVAGAVTSSGDDIAGRRATGNFDEATFHQRLKNAVDRHTANGFDIRARDRLPVSNDRERFKGR